jgi:glycosyltransferase involved in cell wall biosynthesis
MIDLQRDEWVDHCAFAALASRGLHVESTHIVRTTRSPLEEVMRDSVTGAQPRGLADTSGVSSEDSDLVVAVWKKKWLAGSETFVRNQLDAFLRLNAIAIGALKLDSPVAAASDRLLFGQGRIGRAQEALFLVSRRSRRLEHILKGNNVSLIHAHFGTDATLVAPTARRLKIPLAVTVHGFDVTSAPRRRDIQGFVYRRRLRRMFREAAVILPVSDFIASRASAWGAPLGKTSVHYIGIPLGQPVEKVDARTDVIFVGRLVETKGVADLLNAVAGIERSSRPSVLLVGDGPLRQRCENLARDLEVEASFVGWQPPALVRGYLASAKVFVAPSKISEAGDQEGLGMVFLEASHAGLPIVAYRHGGVGEAVVDGVTGLLATEGDVATLGDHIMKLLSDPDLARRMGEAGQRNVSDHFDVLTQTQRLESLFTRLVREHRS